MGVLRTFFTVDLKARVAARPPGDVPPLFRSGALSICGSNSSIKTHRRFGRRWAIAQMPELFNGPKRGKSWRLETRQSDHD